MLNVAQFKPDELFDKRLLIPQLITSVLLPHSTVLRLAVNRYKSDLKCLTWRSLIAHFMISVKHRDYQLDIVSRNFFISMCTGLHMSFCVN